MYEKIVIVQSVRAEPGGVSSSINWVLKEEAQPVMFWAHQADLQVFSVFLEIISWDLVCSGKSQEKKKTVATLDVARKKYRKTKAGDS